MPELLAPREAKGERLDRFLTKALPNFSRSRIQRAILAGRVLLDGKKVAVHHFLKGGEVVVWREEEKNEARVPVAHVSILAEEKDFLVVDKPAGLAVHPGAGVKPPTLVDSILRDYPEVAIVGEKDRPGIVHRLDKDVSGAMLVARTETGYEFLKRAFETRRVEKIYQALVGGNVRGESGAISRLIARSARRPRMAARPAGQAGKEALTHWRVLKRFRNATLLEVKIETGRTHQIRAHLLSIGHPIIGDKLYGRAREKSGLPRLFLHSVSIGFIAPDGVTKKYETELPAALSNYLSGLKPL